MAAVEFQQDTELVQHCAAFDQLLSNCQEAYRTHAVSLEATYVFEQETERVRLSVSTSLPVITSIELNSEKYGERVGNLTSCQKDFILCWRVEDFTESFDAEMTIHVGQRHFSFTFTMSPEIQELTSVLEEMIDLAPQPINWCKSGEELYSCGTYVCVNEKKAFFKLGEIVSLKNNRVGKVCYIGKVGNNKGMYFGVDLIKGKGKHDGSKNEERYFSAHTETSGVFVRLKSILCLGVSLDDFDAYPRMSDEIDRITCHGLMVEDDWEYPMRVLTCEKENRPGYDGKPSHEYIDEPKTMLKKVKLLAQLIRQSENCIAYTGAGISTTAGIDDYASKVTGKESKIHEGRKKVKNFRLAQPTLGHRVLTQLYFDGHLKNWVQQNHDGLPQKAGYPQEHINEIHGGWWDISNPVVAMSGTLRSDLWGWMEEWQEKTDLCVCMGTSLCGMSADACVSDPAERYMDEGVGFGAVIVGLQQTQYDSISSIRIYGKIDEVVSLLTREMGLQIAPFKRFQPDIPPEAIVGHEVYKVPYDSDGKLTKNPDEMIVWDLRFGQKIKVVYGAGKGFKGTIQDHYPGTQHLRINTFRMREGHPSFGIQKHCYYLGQWWKETFTKGLWHQLPFVNEKIQLQKDLTKTN